MRQTDEENVMLELNEEMFRRLTKPEQYHPEDVRTSIADALNALRTLDFERSSWRRSCRECFAIIGKQEKEIDELRPDAGRFRYLCATTDPGRDLRAEVDAEMDKNSAP